MDRLPALSKRITNNIESLGEYADQYKVMTRKISTSVLDQQEEKTLIRNIQEIGNNFKNLSSSVKEKIFKLVDLTKIASGKKEKEIIEWHINGHSKKLASVTNLFREYTFTFKKNEENKTKVLFRAANVNATEEQIDKYISSPNSGSKIASIYSLGDASHQLKLDEASRRQKELKKINDLSEEVIAITKMVSDLTFQKSIEIDNFGDEILDIEDNIIKSNNELSITLKYKIRRGKFLRGLFFIIFVVLVVFLIYKALDGDWFGFRSGCYRRYDE